MNVGADRDRGDDGLQDFVMRYADRGEISANWVQPPFQRVFVGPIGGEPALGSVDVAIDGRPKPFVEGRNQLGGGGPERSCDKF